MATSMKHVKRMERLKKRKKMKKERHNKHDAFADQMWKPFEVDMSAFADEEMSGFNGMEVLTDYDPNLLRSRKITSGTKEKEAKPKGKSEVLDEVPVDKLQKNGKSKEAKATKKRAVGKGNRESNPNKNRSKQKTVNKTNRTTPSEHNSASVQSPNIGAGEDNLNASSTQESTQEGVDGPRKTRKRKSGLEQLQELKMKRKRKKSEEMPDTRPEEKAEEGTQNMNDEGEAVQSTAQDTGDSSEVAMESWENLSIPALVHKSLQDLGYAHPTPIQAACIPHAVQGGKDIVGAAETGSGKTLAFGIPLLYRLLRHKAALASGAVPVRNQPPNATSDAQVDTNMERTEEARQRLDKQTVTGSTTREGEGKEDGEMDAENPEDVAMSDGEDDDENTTNNVSDDGHDMNSDQDDDDDDEDGVEKLDTRKLQSQIGCVDVVDNIDDKDWEKAGLPLANTPYRRCGLGTRLFGLILTPTRELAVQVKNHIVAAAQHTDIKVAVVVGGLSMEKQRRVLKKRPEIIVGTPGRLWELYKLGEPHLASLPDVQCLVIDEADRMVERGHYAELAEILDILNESELKSSRQTFVFSATLSLIHLGPLRKSLKKQYKNNKKEKLDSVMSKIGIKENAEVVDLTKKEGTASTLLESKIVCEVHEKDIYLFYFLRQYPGRTLVFTNSIDCIRRLVSILALLDCKPLPLHSSMHQKQRLKNLERFTSNPQGLLLATDVAARGLDIPDVEHVIHYQVPRTSESYVHRSGRTARQAKVGLSVTFVSPNEINFYRRLCKTLNREEIASFPVEQSFYQAVSQRVDLARDIDKLEHVNAKKRHQNDWFVKAAQELDVDVDAEMNLHDMGDLCEQKQFTKKLRLMKGELKGLLRKRIFPSGASQLYLTSTGKLLSPFSQASVGAHEAVSKLTARIKKDREDKSKEKDKKRKKFKRMGRYQTSKTAST